jgi:hypothetical protein
MHQHVQTSAAFHDFRDAALDLIQLLKSIVIASKLGWGKSAALIRSDAPMTRAPCFRNARVTDEPSPPLAPVMKTT